MLLVDENGHWPSLKSIVKAVATVAVAAVAVTAVVATAGAAGAAVGVAAGMYLGVSSATAVTISTVATVGAYAVAGGIGATALSDAGEELTGTNVIRDKLMGGNQELYDTVEAGLYTFGAGYISLGADNYGLSGGKTNNTTVHGNSKSSSKVQHGYEIYKNKNGDVVKTGISGQPLNKNGTSPRANYQVNKLNKEMGSQEYAARIVKTGISGREKALEWERENSMRLWNEGNSMELHRRPRPWEE